MIRYYALAAGCVQGVGFRWFARQLAGRYSLTGWVRNRDDGAVDLEVQGQEIDVDTFLDRVRQGGRYIEVERLELRRLDPVERERSFEILD